MKVSSRVFLAIAFASGLLLGAGAGVVWSRKIVTGQIRPDVGDETPARKERGWLDELIAAGEHGDAFPPQPLDWLDAAEYVRSHPDHSSFHLRFPLRREAPGVYADIPARTKPAILCSALARVSGFELWGWLGTRDAGDGLAAKALLETGTEAIPYLKPLLDNYDPITYESGGELAIASERYQTRRADFAYRYISLILGEKPVFSADPNDRDEDIQRLKERLRKR